MPEAARTFEVRGRDDAALAAAAKAAGVALSVDELRRVANGLGRDPTAVELYAFDAQWSEHCSYKSSREYLLRLPTTSPDVIVGVGEDAGIVRLGEFEGETYGIVVAHESHNHPSQVVPFEGAATGIGGIVRDVLCMGARVIAVADPLRFGSYDDPHARYVAQGVVDGIAAYGNAIGVPNIAGDTFFHPGFDDNVLVNVVALGLVKEKEIIHSRAPQGSEGWDIVLVGKATDRSGFGGASFSSVVLDEADREANRSAVQVPDPFLKSVIMRASYRAFDAIRDAGITVGFKDLGAGGIMGCTAELVASGGMGAVIDLERCPTSQPNLPPEVIAIGETQERLAWVVPPSFTPELLRIYNEEYTLPQIARGACAAVIGAVTREQRYVLRYYGETVMDVDTAFLTSGVRYERPCAPIERRVKAHDDAEWWARQPSERDSGGMTVYHRQRYADHLAPVLAHRDVCSRAPIYQRYDSVVRGRTVLPDGVADAGALIPVPGAPFALVLGVGGNPRYGAIDAQLAAEHAVGKAVRSVVAAGARPVGLTDCLNFGNPESGVHMAEFVASVDGLAHAARALDLAFISGNVSLYNQSARGDAVPASPIVACIGVADDVSVVRTGRFKQPDSALFVLGSPRGSIAGSVIAEVLDVGAGGMLSTIDYQTLRKHIAVVQGGLREGTIATARDVSAGGLLATACKMAFGSCDEPRFGFVLDSGTRAPDRDGWSFGAGGIIGFLEAVFEEFPGFVVEVVDEPGFATLVAHTFGFTPDPALTALPSSDDRPQHWPRLWIERIGRTIAEPVIDIFGERLSLDELQDVWEAPLRDFYEVTA